MTQETSGQKTSGVTRRDLFAASAAAMAAAAVVSAAPWAMAAAPPTAGQGLPTAHRYRFGTVELTALSDGYVGRPLDEGFVTNAPLDEVQAALDHAFRPTDVLNITFTTTVVNTGTQLVLVDAGTGGQFGPTTGAMAANLAAAGIEPGAIDAVIISHFHPDHILGLKTGDGQLAFPNAEIMVPEAEWAFWMDDGQMSRAPEGMQQTFQATRRIFGDIAGNIRRYGQEEELLPGLTAVPAFGHTPGHTVLQVASGDQAMMLLADVTNVPYLFVRNPDWSAVFDMDAAMARETRRRLLDRAAADRLLVAGYHWGLPNAGHIRREGQGYAFVPLSLVTSS